MELENEKKALEKLTELKTNAKSEKEVQELNQLFIYFIKTVANSELHHDHKLRIINTLSK